MIEKSVYEQVQQSLSRDKAINEKRLIEKGVKAERERVFSLSVNEFLIEKLNYKLENKTVCVEQPASLDEREMKLMDWTDFGRKGDE